MGVSSLDDHDVDSSSSQLTRALIPTTRVAHYSRIRSEEAVRRKISSASRLRNRSPHLPDSRLHSGQFTGRDHGQPARERSGLAEG